MTFDQIVEIRRGEQPSLSLKQAHDNLVRLGRAAGLTYEQCGTCGGHGYTKATLLASLRVVEALAKACPDEPVAIQYDRCPDCGGGA